MPGLTDVGFEVEEGDDSKWWLPLGIIALLSLVRFPTQKVQPGEVPARKVEAEYSARLAAWTALSPVLTTAGRTLDRQLSQLGQKPSKPRIPQSGVHAPSVAVVHHERKNGNEAAPSRFSESAAPCRSNTVGQGQLVECSR